MEYVNCFCALQVVLSRAHVRGVKPDSQQPPKPVSVDEDEALAAQSAFVVMNETVHSHL